MDGAALTTLSHRAFPHFPAPDHLAYRYEILGLLGRGAFGQVVKVYDYKTQQVLACKIIRNRRRYQNQAMTEVRILNLLMQQVCPCASVGDFLCLHRANLDL